MRRAETRVPKVRRCHLCIVYLTAENGLAQVPAGGGTFVQPPSGGAEGFSLTGPKSPLMTGLKIRTVSLISISQR